MQALKRLVITLLVAATAVVPSAPSSGRMPSARYSVSSIGDDGEKPDYAPIVERKLDFYDFTYKTAEERRLNLREYAEGKSVIIVEYFAGWCANSNRNGHVIERLWAKYRERGLGVIGVAEYSDADELRIHVNRIGIEYPIVIETKKRTDRKDSFHFKYRRAAGDKRKWGTPFYVIIDTRDIESIAGKAPLARRVFTVSGELVEAEAEQFIEARLTRGAAR
jgi:hypothetical protein